MSKREEFDNVCASIRNGQRTQAYRQMCELNGDERAEMLEYFERELNDTDLALDAARTFFRRSGK